MLLLCVIILLDVRETVQISKRKKSTKNANRVCGESSGLRKAENRERQRQEGVDERMRLHSTGSAGSS